MSRPRRDHADCPYEAAAQALKRLGGRWKILIVRRLIEDREIGFNALQRAIPGVSAKMLAQQLRELEADGVVTREEQVSTPPKTVVYRLTALGGAVEASVHALSEWGALWIRARRDAGDA